MTLAEAMVRYRAAFGEDAPLMFWAGPDEQLTLMLEEAVRAGKALTQDDLIRRQGGSPAPIDAIY